jgi:parallel beta-helix repeat protein
MTARFNPSWLGDPMSAMLTIKRLAVVLVAASALAACGSGEGISTPASKGRVFKIEPGPNATGDMVAASVSAAPKDVIEFGCGYFDLSSGLLLQNTEEITVRGCGREKTVLSFRNSESPEGILAINVRGLVVEGLSVLDSPGDAIKMKGVDHGTLRNVRTIWSSARKQENEDTITKDNFKDKLEVACTDPARNEYAKSRDYTVSRNTGRYGIYPVESRNILVENSESIGASDAGIYVGQTNNAIIKNSRAAYNVMGFEIENVQGGEYDTNIAECNTGGFLIYDLDALTQYGDRSRMFNNISRNNNSYNFNSGGFVGNVPRGVGFITLSYDRIEAFNNIFENNDSAGMILTSYELVDPGLADKKIDFYSEGVHIHNNKFINNGNRLPLPDLQTILASGGSDINSALPLLMGLKNVASLDLLNGAGLYRGGHIVWDGLYDELSDCPYPVDSNGQPVPKDARGKPQLTNEHPNPSCHYNAYKFNAEGERIKPEWFTCINDNEFVSGSTPYLNFHGIGGLEALDLLGGNLSGDALIAVVKGIPQLRASADISVHDCQAKFGKVPEPLPPVVIPPFTPSGNASPAPSDQEIARLCGASVPATAINSAALGVNCPTLDQYNLFADPEDPRSAPNGGGVPYSLTSKLFSDYSNKYRVVFLPPGEKAIYKSAKEDGANAAILFPVGTVIAKTFAFTDVPKNTENSVETRLLIKRRGANGQVRWDGLPYIWATENGRRVARLTLGGGQASVSWDFTDLDSNVAHKGSTPSYAIPHANQCITCHTNDDVEAGSAPIGPKVRFLNRAYRSESSLPTGQAQHPVAGVNQIQYWCEHGLMTDCPTELGVDPNTQIAMALNERIPIFNKPGDSGAEPNSKQDIEARARAYLEVNCQHCHNPRGAASNTGLYLDTLRAVNTNYGVCKGVTAAGGEGTGGRDYDIHPGKASNSVIPFRMGTNDVTARMPPIARSVTHEEAVVLIEQWINTVVDNSYEGADACSGNGRSLLQRLMPG